LQFAGRNSWEAWKAGTPEADLRAFLEDFVVRHEDDVAQEERWRAKMMRRITMHFESLEGRVTALAAAQQQQQHKQAQQAGGVDQPSSSGMAGARQEHGQDLDLARRRSKLGGAKVEAAAVSSLVA
jgi:hypothetical protein